MLKMLCSYYYHFSKRQSQLNWGRLYGSPSTNQVGRYTLVCQIIIKIMFLFLSFLIYHSLPLLIVFFNEYFLSILFQAFLYFQISIAFWTKISVMDEMTLSILGQTDQLRTFIYILSFTTHPALQIVVNERYIFFSNICDEICQKHFTYPKRK